MRPNPLHSLFIALAGMMTATSSAIAGLDCCDKCGCDHPCQKVCRLVKEEKKVEVICWGSKKVDFCLPKPSKPGCKHCETVCDPCDDVKDTKDVHSKPKRFVWFDWIPGCAKMHTKTVLMKRIETKTIPSYKWVVEDLCASCQATQKSAEATTTAANEPTPTETPLAPVTAQALAEPPVNSTRLESFPTLETPRP